jgi:hypothetical protein
MKHAVMFPSVGLVGRTLAGCENLRSERRLSTCATRARAFVGESRACPVRPPRFQHYPVAGERLGEPRSHATRGEDARVSPGIVLLVSVLVGVGLLVIAGNGRLVQVLSRWSAALAALPLVTAVLLTVYVFGEDSYRGNGISRWDAYRSPGGALGPMFVTSVALMAVCAALLLYAGLRGRGRLLRLSAFVAGLASLALVTATIIGFSSN